MLETEHKIRLLKDEVESWKPFIDALRAEDREIARQLIERCWRFADAIESSKKKYLVEPLFMTILLIQEERIRWLQSEFRALKAEIESWKLRAGS
jgi:hypothetical protein